MTGKHQKAVSVLLITLIIVLAVFFWLLNQDKDLGNQLMVSTIIPERTDYVMILSEQLKSTERTTKTPGAVFMNSTSTHSPTDIPTTTPTTTPTATPTTAPIVSPTFTPTPMQPIMGFEIIGHSVLERSLEVYRFGTGEHAHMIVAGIHGGYEWNTVKLAYELIDYLKANPGIIPDDKTLYILPNLNPDGYENDLGPDGRANANNVDINRNWDSNWQKSWYGKNCWSLRPIQAGDHPESEPETRALKNFLTNKKVEALISYHSAAYNIFAGGYPNDQMSINLAKSLSNVSPYYFPPNYGDCLYTGQFVDWASDQGIAAVDIELKNHQETDYEINIKILEAFINWSYPEG